MKIALRISALLGVSWLVVFISVATSLGQEPAKNAVANVCQKCRGLKFVPYTKHKPYFHIEGQKAPKPADALRGICCPECSVEGAEARCLEQEAARIAAGDAFEKLWEERAYAKFTRIETRHATIYTTYDAKTCREMGEKLEELCAHLQKLTGNLALTRTDPATYHLFALTDKPQYFQFREVVEKHLPKEQLGPPWEVARNMGGIAHPETPVFFGQGRNTPKTNHGVHGVVQFVAAKQIGQATSGRAPGWVTAGFASYAEHQMLRKVVWRMAYEPAADDKEKINDYMLRLKQHNQKKELSPIRELLAKEIQTWSTMDEVQNFGLVSYLLESEPAKFVDFLERIREGKKSEEAIEAAYGKTLEEMDKPFSVWIRAER